MLKDVDVASLQTQLHEQLQALGEHQAATHARELIERLQATVLTQHEQLQTQHKQIKFEQTKNAALNL